MMGKAKNSFKFLAVLMFGFILLQYQNCGPKGSGSLTLGSTATGTNTSAGLSAVISPNPVTITTNTFFPSPLILSSSGGTAPLGVSAWVVYTSTGTLVTSGVDMSQCVAGSYSCNLKFTTAGSYVVRVTVTDSKGIISQPLTNITVTSSGSGNPTVCTTSYGWIDSASINPDTCALTVSGWAWNPTTLQNTQVQVVAAEVGLSNTITVNGIRDDVNGVYACIPKSPTGNPGFSTTIANAYSEFESLSIVGYVLNANGTQALTLNSITISVPLQCVYNYNPCPRNQICQGPYQ